MKTRGDSIAEYSAALKREDGNMEAATILYGKLELLFSNETMNKDMKIRCIAEEIDNIICGYMKGGVVDEI